MASLVWKNPNPKTSPLEGEIIERKTKTVGQLVEELLKLDLDMVVLGVDSEYGLQEQVSFHEEVLEQHSLSSYQFKALGLEVGQKIVAIY